MIDTLTSDAPLISRERTDTLELLLHLLANSSQPLVLLGPVGIGKTKMLEVLKELKKNTWHCCSIVTDESAGLDAFLKQIAACTGSDEGQLAREGLADAQDKVIALVDDAGRLPPGEAARIVEYALANPLLRLVLALTPDELFIKNRTDTNIDECYFIELPLLTKKQCGDFLHGLVTKPGVGLPVNRITEHLIETVYLQSQGIPGRIVTELPALLPVQKRDYALWLLIAAVLILVAIALLVQWLSGAGYF